jgi:hypothetical protein
VVDVGARGDFGDDATEGCVLFELAEHEVCAYGARVVNNCDGRFITACFYA